MTIKNGDLPAMPIYLTETIAIAAKNGADEVVSRVSGLTKREQFAVMAMQGLIASGIDFTMHSDEDVTEAAVRYADLLLTELERTK